MCINFVHQFFNNFMTPGTFEFDKLRPFILADIIEYVPNSVVIKVILTKTTGNVSLLSSDSSDPLTGKILPFDTLIHVIDGKAEFIINKKSHLLNTGEAIIIPAHTHSVIKSTAKFKIMSTVIKSGYEDLMVI